MPVIRVLFVDDDPSLQTLAGVMINKKVFQVLGAMNTREADAVLAQHPIDVVVCDVLMPGENGLEYYKRLTQKGFSRPFLFLSACGDPRSIGAGLAAGASDYLVKPFDMRELEHRILLLLAKSLHR